MVHDVEWACARTPGCVCTLVRSKHSWRVGVMDILLELLTTEKARSFAIRPFDAGIAGVHEGETVSPARIR